ncbi:YfdX family protein [Acetobacter persici]|uniref:YfdX family protein n=1 Tax=Acetobacter persici TaxID=1076596 RepID=UPI001BA69028|nr:YfdX family protein [Acetobacter persici]MBS1000749.1 YfdX family protein [Acetobacter persici]
MRFNTKASLAALAVLTATPMMAHASSLHTKWEQFKAGRAFRHLSADGQRAMADIVQARETLAAGKTDAAIPALYDAQKRLTAASKAETKFNAAESQLQPAPQHPASPDHTPATTPTTWIPVGGEFIATETLAPEKKAAVATANGQLKAGQTDQAAQTMQVVGEDADFIVALAPLAQTQGALNRATVFTEGKQASEAVAALDQILNGLVFVSEDFAESAMPDHGKAPAKSSH